MWEYVAEVKEGKKLFVEEMGRVAPNVKLNEPTRNR